MDWLTELNSFDLQTNVWSRLTLSNVFTSNLESTPVVAGQSGCFLPPGDGLNEPSLLILFGGIAQIRRVCINDVYIVSPESGLWMGLYESKFDEKSDTSWPCGRCGHSVCALDSHRMLLLFGNMDSPLASSFESSASSVRQQRMDSCQSSTEYRGRPANDFWILTRSIAKLNNKGTSMEYE